MLVGIQCANEWALFRSEVFMGFQLTGDQYKMALRHLADIQQQLSQDGGYRYPPEQLIQQLQDISGGRFANFAGLMVPSIVKPVCTVVKSLTLEPYRAKSIAHAIRLGKYDHVSDRIHEDFAEDEMGLTQRTIVHLVKFKDPFHDEILIWAAENQVVPIMPKHLLGIGIQHPDEYLQEWGTIAGLGSVRRASVLVLDRETGNTRSLQAYDNTNGTGRYHSELRFGFLRV